MGESHATSGGAALTETSENPADAGKFLSISHFGCCFLFWEVFQMRKVLMDLVDFGIHGIASSILIQLRRK